MQLVDDGSKKIRLEVSYRPRKSPQTAWTFRAPQIAGRGRLKRQRKRHAPYLRLLGPPGDVKGGDNQKGIVNLGDRQLFYKGDGI